MPFIAPALVPMFLPFLMTMTFGLWRLGMFGLAIIPMAVPGLIAPLMHHVPFLIGVTAFHLYDICRASKRFDCFCIHNIW